MAKAGQVPHGLPTQTVQVTVTYERTVAWAYGNKEAASVAMTQDVAVDERTGEHIAELQHDAKGAVRDLLSESDQPIVRRAVGAPLANDDDDTPF